MTAVAHKARNGYIATKAYRKSQSVLLRTVNKQTQTAVSLNASELDALIQRLVKLRTTLQIYKQASTIPTVRMFEPEPEPEPIELEAWELV